MTSAQLIVFALLIAAFISGWVARGTTQDEKAEPEPEPPAEPAPEVAEAPDPMAEAVAAHEAVIDAWLDGEPPDAVLARFDAALADLRRSTDADAIVALSASAEVFEGFRRGEPLTAGASRRLEETERRLPSRRP